MGRIGKLYLIKKMILREGALDLIIGLMLAFTLIKGNFFILKILLD